MKTRFIVQCTYVRKVTAAGQHRERLSGKKVSPIVLGEFVNHCCGRQVGIGLEGDGIGETFHDMTNPWPTFDGRGAGGAAVDGQVGIYEFASNVCAVGIQLGVRFSILRV